jgi:hypothetical protein
LKEEDGKPFQSTSQMDRKGKERILKSEEDESTLHIHI